MVEKANFNWRRILRLWLLNFFYVVLFYGISIAVSPGSFTWESIIFVVFPILSGTWFITQYFIFIFIVPFLSLAVRHASKKQMIVATIVILIISQLSILLPPSSNISAIQSAIPLGGVSFLWFVCLFFLVATIKLHYSDKIEKINKYWFLAIYVPLAIIMFLAIALSRGLGPRGLLITNSFLPIVIMSFCVFFFFLKVKITNKLFSKIIASLASCMFAVYIIHAQPLVVYNVYRLMGIEHFYNTELSALMAVVYATIVFTCAVLIEYTRRLILRASIIGIKAGLRLIKKKPVVQACLETPESAQGD